MMKLSAEKISNSIQWPTQYARWSTSASDATKKATEIDIYWNLNSDQIIYLFRNFFLQIWIWKRWDFLLAAQVSSLYEYPLKISLEQSSLIWILVLQNLAGWIWTKSGSRSTLDLFPWSSSSLLLFSFFLIVWLSNTRNQQQRGCPTALAWRRSGTPNKGRCVGCQ